ncbi:hypothetical protein CALCODRAFT_189301 [Calocera cornea HHB12733]|uniref:Metallothionein n=1 Tax=Calocera cornea HHB12733 TaxID=1353952 RepID=A0A165C8M5_9BASI|nr:hypothetical protein CALCODRAFT_189301 [Calocera cornea HHB12733]
MMIVSPPSSPVPSTTDSKHPAQAGSILHINENCGSGHCNYTQDYQPTTMAAADITFSNAHCGNDSCKCGDACGCAVRAGQCNCGKK